MAYHVDVLEVSPARLVLGTAGHPLITQNAVPGQRPYLHPLRSPAAHVELTEDAPSHHPWQHGLYIGLNDVNGVGFWTEGLHEGNRPHDGQFRPQPLQSPTRHTDAIRWQVETAYQDRSGTTLLSEVQSWSAHAHEPTLYTLDLAWTIVAGPDIRFGRCDYGGLFLRVPFRGNNVQLHSSAGATSPQQAEGQLADWVALCLLHADQPPASIALICHGANPYGQPLWRTDHEFGIGPCPMRAEPILLGAGERWTLRYRVIVADGQLSPETLAAHHTQFSRLTDSST